MKKSLVCILVLLIIFASFGSPAFAQTLDKSKNDAPTADFLVQGFDAFQRNDWASALFFLRKAVSLPDAASPEVWYMLVMSEMFAEEYESAIKDGEYFCAFYPDSPYRSFVDYQIGRALHYTGDYDGSIKRLGLFCSRNPGHELYSAGLFWMAESLYATYYFDLAKPVYQRIVTEFPASPKYTESLYRIDLINQREREEKLLYLLKVTGEEYLSAKEEYERQLRQYQTEETMGTRRQSKDLGDEVVVLKAHIAEVERERDRYAGMNAVLTQQNMVLADDVKSLKLENESLVVALSDAKKKAELQFANEQALKKRLEEIGTQQGKSQNAPLDTSGESDGSAVQVGSTQVTEQVDSAAIEAAEKAVAEKEAAEKAAAEERAAKSSLQNELKGEIEKLKRKALEIQRQLDIEQVISNTQAVQGK